MFSIHSEVVIISPDSPLLVSQNSNIIVNPYGRISFTITSLCFNLKNKISVCFSLFCRTNDGNVNWNVTAFNLGLNAVAVYKYGFL